MNLFDSGRGYYLLQTTNGTCFLAYLERTMEDKMAVNIALALNSPVGIQLIDLEEVTQAMALRDLGIKEVPVDFREMVSLLWKSSEKTFWDYSWVLSEYFNSLIEAEPFYFKAA